MSDKLNIPAESWRAPRRSVGPLDPQIVRMGLIAAGFAGVVALGVGGYALLGHRSHTVPVVEADSRPIRVRPDNPGGATVSGADEQILGGTGSGKVDAMAPAAEAPAPQALRAQIEAARQPPPVQPAILPPQSAPSPAQKVSLTPLPAPAPPLISDMPENRPSLTAGRPLAHGAKPPIAAQPAASSGATLAGMQVQLGALDSEQAAMTEWQRLSRRMPDLLGTKHPAVMRAEHDGKTFWRLRTGGFSDVASATAFCSQVRSKGVGCSIASF
jgi:hypothetical protein